MPRQLTSVLTCGCLLFVAVFSGCHKSPGQNTTSADPVVAETSSVASSAEASQQSIPQVPSISLGADTPSIRPRDATGSLTSEEHRRQLLEAMMPLQVMLGEWKGTTQRDVGQFKALDQPRWVWDFQTDRNQPALIMTSEGSPYLREARLTFLTDRQLFQMTATDPEGNVRMLEGTFSVPVEEFQGDDQRMHVKYKLALTQVAPTDQREQWQIVFNQQENNRYLQEMARKRGSSYLRFDTVATQRQGTSFAKSDAGYGEKECIISGGLGTIELRYQGKSFWVCCTGCKAAFEEDPDSWIAEYNKKR